MSKVLVALIAAFLLLAVVPPSGQWKWQTHGGTYGTRGISKVAYDTLERDAPAYAENLDWELVMSGSKMPDTWRQDPYFVSTDEAPSKHVMTKVKRAGAIWLRWARDARIENAWDTVAYYFGIAAHYWGDVTCYPHHDNCREWYEENLGEEYGYIEWDKLHDHFEESVKLYRPKIPSLVDSTNLDTFLENADDFLDNWIDNVIPPGSTPDNPMDGWWWQWVQSRKCEDSGIQADLSPTSGSKDCVDLATTLIYSGWVYALGVQDQVGASRITWEGLTDQYF